jgi:hypothetical protein
LLLTLRGTGKIAFLSCASFGLVFLCRPQGKDIVQVSSLPVESRLFKRLLHPFAPPSAAVQGRLR